ncbi:MAG: NADH:ubiquinone oxidoreductase subunit NDUFA12 [Bdellovibrionales bacterium]
MSLLKFLSVMSPAHINLFTAMKRGEKVGSDECGNEYYRGKPRKGYKRERRWVMYADDKPESTTIPPEWHGWIHHQNDDIPSSEGFRRSWQKPHQQNMTGTKGAYRPPGHVLEGGKRDKATGDYEAWKPE